MKFTFREHLYLALCALAIALGACQVIDFVLHGPPPVPHTVEQPRIRNTRQSSGT
jgi:hypothetical protein